MGKRVRAFINGDEQKPMLGAAPTAADLKNFKGWHENAKKVLVVSKCFKLNDCAYIGCRNAEGGMGYIDEVV